MQHKHMVRLLLLLLHSIVIIKGKEDDVVMEVIVESSPCSATCGLGVKTQKVCSMKDGIAAMEEDGSKADRAEVSQDCRQRQVKCLESWQCGLTTMTVTSGQRVVMDCLEEVMRVMGRFTWRVSWRYARGVITSTDALFARWTAPLLDRVVLDPVGEEHAGTYCCMVQNAKSRRVKRVYWGIRVLPVGIVNLDYESLLAEWESQQNQTVWDQPDDTMPLHYIVLISFVLAFVLAGSTLFTLHWTVKKAAETKTAPEKKSDA